MGTYRHKKTRNMKPYRRKRGGGQFQFTGKVHAPVASNLYFGKGEDLLSVMLQKIGFRTDR